MDVKTLIEKLQKLEPSAQVSTKDSLITIEGKEVVELVVHERTDERYLTDLLKNLGFDVEVVSGLWGIVKIASHLDGELESHRLGEYDDYDIFVVLCCYFMDSDPPKDFESGLRLLMSVEGYLTEESMLKWMDIVKERFQTAKTEKLVAAEVKRE